MQSVYELNRFNFSADQNVSLSDAVKKSALAAIKKWQKRDHLSGTAKLVALDCVVDSTGELKIFSFDRLPQGFQLLNLRRKDTSSSCDAVVSQSSYHGFFGGLHTGGTIFPEHPGAILAEFEAALDEETAAPYRSSTPYNNYGENWLWQRVSFGLHEEVIDYDKGFSLKAVGQRRVLICPPRGQRSRFRKSNIGGRRTVSQMTRTLAEYGEMYYQPFIQPMQSPMGNPMIYSLYFQYDDRKRAYVYSGGLSISRKHLNVVLNRGDVVLGVID